MESTSHKSSAFASIVLYEAMKYNVNKITVMNEKHEKEVVEGKVKRLDKSTAGKVFLELENGDKIDFETIYSVDEEYSPKYTDNSFKCDCV